MHDHHWSISDIENMIPFEMDIYVGLLQNWLAREKERHERENR